MPSKVENIKYVWIIILRNAKDVVKVSRQKKNIEKT
jgi:hypothetical protein